MSSKHTSGPWNHGRNANADGWLIASYPVDPADPCREVSPCVHREEDARLVAAAPDLLAACKLFKRWASECGVIDPLAPEDVAVWDAAIAAIAKAEGN